MPMDRSGYGRGSLSRAANVAISQRLEKEAYINLFLKQIIENARKDSKFLVQYTDIKGLFDVPILNRLSINIRKRVLSGGRIIYCSDRPGPYDYNFKIIEKLAEFGPRFKRILENAAESTTHD